MQWRERASQKPEIMQIMKFSYPAAVVPALWLALVCAGVVLSGDLPPSYDLRELGIITPVKSQGECGSCGEFAGIAVLEALIKKETGIEIDLSEQQIVSCTPGCGCGVGCSSLTVLQYLRDHGVAPEKAFPYVDRDLDCADSLPTSYRMTTVVSTNIDRRPLAERIKIIKETILEFGPVATNMGLYDDLDRYRSGVYTYDGKSEAMGGHWVVLVGWRDDAEVPSGGYWICRNSWGEKWGQGGYFNSAYGDATGIDDYYIVYGTYQAD